MAAKKHDPHRELSNLINRFWKQEVDEFEEYLKQGVIQRANYKSDEDYRNALNERTRLMRAMLDKNKNLANVVGKEMDGRKVKDYDERAMKNDWLERATQVMNGEIQIN